MSRKVPLQEVAFLCLPLLLIFLVAIWVARRPKTIESPPVAPQPFGLRVVEFKKLPLTAYDVSRGADTKVRIKVETMGSAPRLNFTNWNWENYVRVVAVKNGRAQLLEDDDTGVSPAKRILRNGEGGGMDISNTNPAANSQVDLRLRLRDINQNAGDLELRWDWALGPNTLNPKPNETSAMEMARLQKDPKGLFLQTRLPLRKGAEKIARPVVSTDPMFDVRSVEFKPSPQADAGDVQIVLHVYYRGPLRKENQGYDYAKVEHNLSSGSGFSYGDGTGGAIVNRVKGLRHCVLTNIVDTKYARQRHPHLKKLVWNAFISVNGAWPRQVKVPIELPIKYSSKAR